MRCVDLGQESSWSQEASSTSARGMWREKARGRQRREAEWKGNWSPEQQRNTKLRCRREEKGVGGSAQKLPGRHALSWAVNTTSFKGPRVWWPEGLAASQSCLQSCACLHPAKQSAPPAPPAGVFPEAPAQRSACGDGQDAHP